jgi:thymidylate synthase
MYNGIPPQKSCALAWVAACTAIIDTSDEGYNVVIDVTDPVTHSEQDNEVITLVDKFLRGHETPNPIVTVANTIFPQALLAEHGPDDFYEVYHRDFAKFSHSTRQWGRYFQRMTRHVDYSGNQINPLQDLIDKMKANEKKQTRLKAVYELAVSPPDTFSADESTEDIQDITIYQPSRDRRRRLGGPCLSYLSFKRHPTKGLLLTAMYRNHYYITRLLGNLIGLGRLQAFVASQVQVPLGELTVISTHAELDKGKGEGKSKWGIVEARELVESARRIIFG